MIEHRCGGRLCFISCAAAHQTHAEQLRSSLQKLFPETIEFFIGVQSVKAGEPWHDKVIEKLREAYVVLVLLSPNTVGRPWLIFESGAAMAVGAKLVPLRFCGLRPELIPEPLKTIQSVDLTQRNDIGGLIEQMTTALPPNARAEKTCTGTIVNYFAQAKDAPPPDTEAHDWSALRSTCLCTCRNRARS